MTKREYLKSIGYECYSEDDIYVKLQKFGTNNNQSYCALFIKLGKVNKVSIQRKSNLEFESQKDIDDLQIAFNNLKRDFESMLKYEN